MLNIKEIEEEIKKLENSETTYRNCEKLAILYIVKDHYNSKKSASPNTTMTPATM